VKLSGDMQFIRHECRQTEKSVQELASAIETISKNLDVKVTGKRQDVYGIISSSNVIDLQRPTSKRESFTLKD